MKKRTAVLLASAALAAAAMAGCSNGNQNQSTAEETLEASATGEASTEVTQPAEEEPGTQLVIAGGDGAGLVAAIQAVEEGTNPASILIVESGNELAADVREKEAFINAAYTNEQYLQEIEDSYEIYLADIMKAGSNQNVTEMAELLSESSEQAKDWLAALGIEYGEMRQETGSSVARSFPAKEGELNVLTAEALIKKVEELQIPIELGTTLTGVEYNSDGAVSGVTLEADGEEQTVETLALIVTDSAYLSLFEDAQTLEDGSGLIISNSAEALNEEGEGIYGLYAAGAIVEAGIHGAEALPGNELTAMIVFGVNAGTEASIYAYDNQ